MNKSLKNNTSQIIGADDIEFIKNNTTKPTRRKKIHNSDSSTKTLAKSSAKPSAKPSAKSSAKSSAKPSAKSSPKTSPKPSAKSSPKTSAKPSAKSSPKPPAKSSAKPRVKSTKTTLVKPKEDSPARSKKNDQTESVKRDTIDENKNRYIEVLKTALMRSEAPINDGETITFIWNNEKHFEQWENLRPESEPLRIMRAPSQYSKFDHDIDNATIVVMAYSTEEDYSDLDIIFYMLVKRQ